MVITNSTHDEERSQPGLMALSPAFIYRLMPIPKNRQSVNSHDSTFVTLPYSEKDLSLTREADAKIFNFVSEWNMLWEAGWTRAEILDFPPQFNWLKRFAGERIQLLIKSLDETPVHYMTLYHLLPIDMRRKHKLPLIRQGKWPILAPFALNLDHSHIPLQNLRSAFVDFMWPFLFQGHAIKSRRAYSQNSPLVILSESLDFWADHLHEVIEETWLTFPRVPFDDADQFRDAVRAADDEIDVLRPKMGGMIWEGEDEAIEVAHQMMESADWKNKLRETIDLVLRHQVHDDFSERWSREKEDFERAFYHKRAKTKVFFREIPDDTVSINPLSTIDEKDILNELMTIVSPRERQVIVCLRSGILRQEEIAQRLGYANHSSVSRLLKRIAEKAKRILEE